MPCRTRLLAFFALTLAASGHLHAQTNGTFVYDWSTASASPGGEFLQSNDGWQAAPSAIPPGLNDDIVRTTGQPDGFFSDNYLSSTFAPGVEAGLASLYTRDNDADFGFSIPANASSVDLSFVLQASSAINASRFGLEGPRVLNFGVFGGIAGPGVWGVRQVEDGPGGDGVTSANGVGAAQLDDTLRTYRANLLLDLTAPGTLKSVDLVIDNLTDGGSEVIFDDLPFELGANADPSQWDTLYLRSARTSVDDLTISFTVVPEPASLLMLAWFGAAAAACRRK